MDYQITLFSTTGKYKPVSAIVKNQTEIDLKNTEERKEVINKGVQKICLKRYWDKRDLLKGGYTKAKIREYDPAAIKKENEERYAKIKEEKYASGEWKRPKEREVTTNERKEVLY